MIFVVSLYATVISSEYFSTVLISDYNSRVLSIPSKPNPTQHWQRFYGSFNYSYFKDIHLYYVSGNFDSSYFCHFHAFESFAPPAGYLWYYCSLSLQFLKCLHMHYPQWLKNSFIHDLTGKRKYSTGVHNIAFHLRWIVCLQ